MTKRIPLHELHVGARAKMAKYGAWEAPALYSDIRKEYDVLRNKAGLVDLCCATKFVVKGDCADDFLDQLVTGNVGGLIEESAIYTACCRENGSVLALVLILRRDDQFIILADPQVREELWTWLTADVAEDVECKDKSEELACLSVMGPDALEVVQQMVGDDIIGLPYLGHEECEIAGIQVVIARIGNFGEYDFRFVFPADSTALIWEEIIKAAGETDTTFLPCGLEVLDILMLEMKTINPRKDMDGKMSLLTAGLHWMVDFGKDAFVGRDAIFEEKEKELAHKLILLEFESNVALGDRAVLSLADKGEVGIVKHWEYSATVGKNIGMGCIVGEYAWVGLQYRVETTDGAHTTALAVSNPMFETKTTVKIRQ